LYDLFFIWVSESTLIATGYSLGEVRKLRNIDIMDTSHHTEADIRKELIQRITRVHGENEYYIKHKNTGTLFIKIAYHVFEFEQGWFLAGKVLSILPQVSDKM
jgi:hypothetical protein